MVGVSPFGAEKSCFAYMERNHVMKEMGRAAEIKDKIKLDKGRRKWAQSAKTKIG